MNTAVKMQSMTTTKAGSSQKLVSQGSSVKSEQFNKLLQVKKDRVESGESEQAKKPETGKTESQNPQTGTSESKKTEDTAAKKPSDGKAEEGNANGKTEELEAARQLEALQQVLLQQAAVQITELEPEEQQAAVETAVTEMTAEAVTEATEAGTLPGTQNALDQVLAEAGEQAETTPVGELKAAQAQEKTAKPAEQEKLPEPEPVEKTEPKAAVPVENRKETRGQTDSGETETKGQERTLRNDSGSQKNQRTEESGPDTGISQSIHPAGVFSVNGRVEQPLFQEESHSGVMSMKTTPQALPEDLGKTLAAKLPDTGKTLTIELEPASLGKLTIRMTYEAGRAAVSILATNPRTLEILNARAAEIATILEEKTGQETVIVTQQPQEQEEYQENKHGAGQQGQSEEGRQEPDKKEQQSDSFAQQLRLGLV